MILLVLLASILIVLVTIYQYDEQTKDYNIQRFERKESTTKQTIYLELKNKTRYPVNTENLSKIFDERIHEISSINKLNIAIYNLEGGLLKSSSKSTSERLDIKPISATLLKELSQQRNQKILKTSQENGISYQSSYSFIYDARSKKIGILELQFMQDNVEIKKELKEFISRLGFVYVLMLLIAIVFAYFLSSYITRSIKIISDKIQQTRLTERNEKIILNKASSEIEILVEAYNSMIDELGESAAKLAKSEREQAWREMAKQVAHEIKNPLTPMRLTVQSFERNSLSKDDEANKKLKEFSQSLIQQIDVLSSIASAFSDFAKMPTQKKEQIEIISVVKFALDIFTEQYITYLPQEKNIYANLDKTQLIRIVTNLLKNAIQATENIEHPTIDVHVLSKENNLIISVTDNGKGIAEDLKELIFEPKFTTKTSGMGLGLAITKNIIEAYGGSISFTSAEGSGTVFTVVLPKA
jgi:nitrogen fixation/metabolism regulation signal transduction histidine kinase